MSPSQDALKLARTSIEEAREAEGSKERVIKHYRAAKRALAQVDVVRSDVSVLREVITAFQDLAVVLDSSGARLPRQSAKCKRRADRLRQTLDGRIKVFSAVISPSLLGPGFSREMNQARVNHFNYLTGLSSSSSSIASSVTSDYTSTISTVSPVISVSTALSTRQPSPTTQSVVSIKAACDSVVVSSFFSKDVRPMPYICQLPGPDEQLQTTRQLAYCLALLQAAELDDSLSSDAVKWRHQTLGNSKEKDRLEAMAVEILKEFDEDRLKDASATSEVVQLAPVLEKDHSRSLLKIFVKALDESMILDYHSLQGLAKVIQGAAPGSVAHDDLVIILRWLHRQLQLAHSPIQIYRLLLAISRILDAMVDSQVEGIDSSNLHGPLKELLWKLESDKDPYVTFQAKYATQALLNVPDNENIWQAGFRRGWLVLKGGVGFAKMPDPRDLKDALEGLERVYEASKGGLRMCKDGVRALKTHEAPTFTVKEGLKFKRAWYRALRTAESSLQIGRLAYFKEIVTTSTCNDQIMFQWGICQLLGRFAADIRWGPDTRKEAVAFLEALNRADNIWKRCKETNQVIHDVLASVLSNNGKDFEVARALQEEIASSQSQAWSISLASDLAELTTSKDTLLEAIQSRERRHANLATMMTPKPKLEEMQSALKMYYAPDLVILRVSGDRLDLETCFVNLAIVEAPAQRQKEKQTLIKQAAIFLRIHSFEKLEHTNTQSTIPLEQLFDERKLRDGKNDHPRRILVQGRAGIGKTTLCKKLVYAHQTGLWKDRFDMVLWLPLRQLKALKVHTLEGLFREKFFTQGLEQEGKAQASALAVSAREGKVLFILDGLDEIVFDTEGDERIALRELLAVLFKQKYIVITSRPSGLDRSLLPPIDLELETIGFSAQNVSDFLEKVLEPDAVKTVKDFIRQTPLIEGLVNIPVQLDVICLSWDSLPKDSPAITMTGLYQLMVRNLWRKDALRLNKTAGGVNLTERHIRQMARTPEAIDELMTTELQHLGYLAFKGMNNNHQVEFDEKALLSAVSDLKGITTDRNRLLPPQILDVMKQTSFLHSADADLDSGTAHSRQTWYFLHLTFQEYFAATWIARHFQGNRTHPAAGMMTMEQTTAFVQEHKYNPQFEIVWWMVAGLLQGEALTEFFRILQGTPRDLIGGRHQQILASCLHEARAQLDSAKVALLESELMEWLRFEMKISQRGDHRTSVLGRRFSFPEILLKNEMYTKDGNVMRTLGARSLLLNPTIQSLVTTLKDDNKFLRTSAASALGCQSTLPEFAVQALISALKDDEKDVRSSATLALGNQSNLPELAIQSLIAALQDKKNKEARRSSASALGMQSALQDSAIEALNAALKDDDKDVRSLAASALGNQSMLPESATKSLSAAIKDKNGCILLSAVLALAKQSPLRESDIQCLIAALKDKDKDVKCSAASALGSLSVIPARAIQALIDVINDKNQDVRISATSALSNQPRLPQDVIQSLLAAFDGNSRDVRMSVATILGNQLTLPESAILHLADKLNENGKIRHSAALALFKQSTLTDSVIESLAIGLYDKSKDVRYAAALALSNQPLIVAIKDKNTKDVKISAVSPLVKQSVFPESITEAPTAALKDVEKDVGFSAASELGKQSVHESVVETLTVALKDPKKDVRCAAASALGYQPMLLTSAIQSLIAALNDEHKDVWLSASKALQNQCHSLCKALPDLSEAEIACLYKNHLFRYSCSHVVSLQVLDGKLYLYTEQGLVCSEPIGPEKENFIASVFIAIQRESGIQARSPLKNN
ncbi:hypothetical protein EC968_000531 [Mortierella alpina]|nr:hypothetical protein EC968_000531 [Mortierella alpina]